MAPFSPLFLSFLLSQIQNDLLAAIIFGVLMAASLVVVLGTIWFVGRLLLKGQFREFVHRHRPVKQMKRFFKSQAYRLSDMLTVSAPSNLPVFAAWTEPDEAFAALHVSDKIHNATFRIPGIGFSDSWDTVVRGGAALVGGACGVWS